jgi:sugar/nucleoside kinase (ribokinase family)
MLESSSAIFASNIASLGARGSTGYSRQTGILRHGGYLNVDVVDAIGAGDSFNAGFVYKFLNGNKLAECMEFGNLAGAVCTTKAGGTAAFENREECLKAMEYYRSGQLNNYTSKETMKC